MDAELAVGEAAALRRWAEGFIEDDCACRRYIERADTAGHGDSQQVIAGLANKIVESGAFAAEDQNAVSSEIELVVVGGSAVRRDR